MLSRMPASANGKRWWAVAIVVAAVYTLVGVGFARLANPYPPGAIRFAWRLSAYIASAIAFAAHIGYEHRRGGEPLTTAWHACIAVALGAFGLAAAAAIHSGLPQIRSAFFVWPIVTALPACGAAFVAAWLLRRWIARP